MYKQTQKSGKRFLAFFLSLTMVMAFSFTSLSGTVMAAADPDQTVTDAKEAAFSESATVDGVTVNVKAEKGVFPAGSSLKVKKESVPGTVNTEYAAIAYAFDITIFDKDGNEIQPEGKAEVSFKTGDVKEFDAAVYHMDGKKAEKLSVSEKGDTAKVKTDGFSTYVLVFTVTGAPHENYKYTMGEDQKVTLKELIQSSGYTPTDYGTHYADDSLSYQYNNAESSDSSKVAISNSASPEYYAYCPSGATFNDGEQLSIRIPCSYQYKSSEIDSWHTATYVATISIAVSAVEGNIVAPVPKEGLVYNGKPQTLVSKATTELTGVTFEYKVDNGNWAEWGDNGPQATEVGDHTIYWRANGSKGAVGTGEVEATIADIDVTAPVAEDSLVYNGDKQILVKEPASTNAKNLDIQYATTAVNANAPEVDSVDWKADYRDAVETDAGKYWVWYRVGKKDGNTWIEAAAPAHIDASIAEITVEPPTADDSLVYNNDEQILVKEPASTNAKNLDIQYATTAVNAKAPEVDSVDWKADYRDAVETDAGKYWVWYRVGKKDGNTWIEAAAPAHIDASIEKADCPVKVESIGTLVYDGSDQILVRELNNDEEEFKIQYSVDNKDWTVGYETVKKKEVGDYSIRWKYEGDDNYNPAEGEVETSIVKENEMFADVEYTKKQAETDKDGEWVYDGEKHGIIVTPKVMKQEATTPEEVSDAKVYYSLDKDLTEDNYKTVGTTSAKSVYPKDAGDYTIYYYIESDTYTSISGSVDVRIKKAYLKITVVDKETTYGTFLQYQDYELDEAQNEGFITIKAFKESAETTEWPYIEDGIEGRSNFKFDTGGYEDEMSDAKTYTVKAQRDILSSKNYIIRYKDGKLVVHKKPVTFTWSTPREWTYDGQSHRIDAHINKDDLVGTDGEDESKVTFQYVSDQEEFTNEATNVRRIPDAEIPEKDWEVGDYTAQIESIGGSRGHNYTMYQVDESGAEKVDPATGKKILQETAKETFRINPAELSLKPNDVTAIYGDAAKDNGYTATGLVNGEKAQDVLIGEPDYEFVGYEAGSDVGAYDIKITNVDDPNVQATLHAQNYTVKTEVNEGGLTVVQRAVTLKWAPANTFEYDGQYHEVKAVKAENDYAGNSVLDPEPSYTDAKKVNAGKYTAVAKLGEQDAKNYKILNESDKFSWEITKRPATIYAKNKTIDYGQAPKNGGYYIDKKPLVKNVENGGKLDSIGKVTYKYNYSKNGKPGNYKITPVVNDLNPNYYIAKTVKGKLKVNYKQKILLVQGKASGKNGIRLSWNTVSGASKYSVYFSQCDKGKKVYKPKKIKTIKGKSLRIGKLKRHKCYKFYVVAKNKKGKKLAKSLQSHVITCNTQGRLTNAKSLKVKKEKMTIERGASVKIKSKLTKVRKYRILLDQDHVALKRYTSCNNEVATVSATGVITGMSKGWCKVYVHSANGMWKEIQVTVK